MTTAMNDGRHAGTDRRRARVQAAVTAAVRAGTPLTAAAIARAASVDRTFLYRRRDLLDLVHTAAREPPGPKPVNGPAVSRSSLQTDLTNACARAARLAARVQQLGHHLPRRLGDQAWRESGLGAPTDVVELQATTTRLEQSNTELTRHLEDRRAELDATRAANRELTRALNQRG
ncbi:hypothetical protein GCM10020367_72380 [Streptomyces sannanensis]|uniref:Transposase n=1 Tax=Streptomyces sannanensis TaxID=285536 RepID=A0ABP6SP80_9ACTN